MEGDVEGMVKAYGGDLKISGSIGEGAQLNGGDIKIDGKIQGSSIIVADKIEIGENAQFHGDVKYWTGKGEIDFKNSLTEGTSAFFDSSLMEGRDEFSWKRLGMATLSFWIFYILSALLVLLLLNAIFQRLFASSIKKLQGEFWKGFGYGLIYLFGIPLLIVFAFLIIIGIPISLFLLTLYLFSILFGHLVAALLIVHYVNQTKNGDWGFWKIVLMALGVAIVLRILTLIPFLGILFSIVLLAVSYGLVIITVLARKNRMTPTES